MAATAPDPPSAPTMGRAATKATIDEQGYIKYVGRLKDVIRRGGINIDPLALERVLLSHPLIQDVAVVAVADARLGERIAAVVVPAGKTEPTLQDLTGFLSDGDYFGLAAGIFMNGDHRWFVDDDPAIFRENQRICRSKVNGEVI